VQSWPKSFLPPSPIKKGVHPKLNLFGSYENQKVQISEDNVSIYVCGITPYDATHLGHAATYVTYDLVYRFLTASGASVTYSQNITDVDDPLLERAKRDDVAWTDLARSQIELFRNDMTLLNVCPPNFYEGVVENIELIIQTIRKMVDSGFTYEIDGDIYFDLSKIPQSISNLPFDVTESIKIFRERGGDPERIGKRHPLDNLLWQKARSGEPSWESSFGAGRPGWHVECVAIALGYLESQTETCITLQGGGSDLYFPHHYMSNYQAYSLDSKPLAKIFSHAGMIGYEGEKMSKSKGNLLFVSKMIEEGVDPISLRIALIDRDYRAYFPWERTHLEKANQICRRIRASLSREDCAPTDQLIFQLISALSNDLDTKEVFRLLEMWCQESENEISGGNPGELSRVLDLYLGLAF
jgi:L-cysteine:1D-myo-inositol 2-amino-2-deoxy-alpha-D-glucopyranoside ligase